MNAGRKSWGFPRWGGYGADSEAVGVRLCDYVGCQERGDHPAPKAPGSNERWYFCQTHAAEYNRNWDFFQGMSEEQRRSFAQNESRTASGYRQSTWTEWGGPSDESGYNRQERDALKILDLDVDADAGQIKARYRELAKLYHPDHNKGDAQAEATFQRIQTAYQILRGKAEERPPGSS